MLPVTEKYNFNKFWTLFVAHDRCVSKWDNGRTDQDVFIRRTLRKWFRDKCFQVIFNKYVPGINLFEINEPAYRVKYTMYLLVFDVSLAYSYTEGEIAVKYKEPHSARPQRINIKKGDWYEISIEEDKESWTILWRFYPTEKIKIELPQALK